MVKAKLRPDGRWYGAIYMGKDIYGKKKYKHIYANTEKECNNKIIEFEYKKNNGLLEDVIKNDQLVTLEDFWNDWLDNRVNISDGTLKEYKSVKKVYLSDILKINAKDMSFDKLQYFYNDLLKKTSVKRVLKVSTIFNCFLRKMAVKRNCPVPRDVLDGLELPTAEKYIPNSIKENDYKHAINQLLAEYNNTHSNMHYLYPIILIASCCGCRLGEITALTVNDIDFDNNVIKVNKQQTFISGKGYVIIEKTKTESGIREIAMLPMLKEKLFIYVNGQQKRIRLLQQYGFKPQEILYMKKDGTTDYISSFDLLITTNKGHIAKKNTVQRNWKSFKKNNNINEKTRIHDFRRYFATLLMKNGIPDKIAKKLLGHSQIDMTQYYQNADEEIIQDYVKNININL